MFKFGRKSLILQDQPEPIMRSKSNSFSIISPRAHHTITFNSDSREAQKSAQLIKNQTKFGRKTLPVDYAETLLNLEIDIELNENTPIDVFQQLIALYMDGVEYYESVKDRKYVYFQRKLNGLMTKPSFLMSTGKQPSPHKNDAVTSTVQNTSTSETKKKEFLDQQKQLELNLIYGDSESKESKVNEIVQSHTDQVKRIDDMIQQDKLTQVDVIQKRLEKRRKSGMSRNFSLPIIEVEDATLQEATTQLNLNAENEKTTVRDASHAILPILEEDDEEAGRIYRVPKYPKRKIHFNTIQDPRLIKRQSLLVGYDVISQLMKRSNTKKERSKTFPSREYLKVIFKEDYTFTIPQDDKDAVNKELQEAHIDLTQVYNKITNQKTKPLQFNVQE